MDNPNSPLDTLRQLKEMLDSGAITPTEFEALKQRLVFTAPATPTASATPVAPASIVPEPVVPPTPPVFDRPPVATEPVLPLVEALPEPGPVHFTAGPEPLPGPEPAWRTRNEFPPMAEEPARNPLALVFAIGGVLAFLAVVLYLNLNRPPSEHISSTSQTAADSLAAPIETGPQAEPLPATAAAPETVRVAPAHPAPVIQPRTTPTRSDSVETASPPTASDSAARQ
ncbi:hypothetical protein GCM10028822_19870 [Hymenobacter terrigena]